jgi:hypothetical protein
LLALSVAGDYYTPWTEQFFLVGLLPLVLIGFGGPVLGVTMLRRRFRPRATAWLLIGFLPCFMAITEVTSMGNALLPLMWGWALAAHAVARGGATEQPALPDRVPVSR